MNDSNDFRELWQSQPIVQGPAAKVPRFGLLEDLTVPVFAPLAPWRRVSYALWAVSPIHFNWQTNLAPEWLHKATGWTALVLGLACLCLILVVRDRTQEPQPEENLQSYGKALVNEFERQFSLERWILILLCVDSIAVSILWSTAEVLAGVYCQAPAHKCKWFSVKGLPARVCITHAGYYGVRPTRVNPRDFVAAGFVWKAQWRCVADPSLPARGTAVRIAGFG